MNIKNLLFYLISSAESALFPQRCIGCDEILEPWERDNGVCTRCIRAKKVILAKEPVCMKCGKPLEDSAAELCSGCMRRAHSFTQAKAVFCYDGKVRDGMYRFKYGNRRCYARTYAKNALRLHVRWLKRICPDAIIPVPMYSPKERKRGYNQAAVFAGALSARTGIPCYRNLLIRNRDTVPQKLLGATERQKNLEKAFQIKDFGVKLKQVLLVDDIYTTGATVDEAARCLIDAGVENVYVLTVCIGKS